MALPRLTESVIRAGASPEVFQRGKDLHRSDAISNASLQGALLTGDCEGTQAPYYRVTAELDEAGIRFASCTCPYEFGGYCKHVVALLLTYLHHPESFAVRQKPEELLGELDREALHALLSRLLRERPELYDWVEAAIAVPQPGGKGKPARRKKVDAEVYRRQVRDILHSLDSLRASEAYWHVGGLVQSLDGVRDTAMKFLDAGDPETALAILETLLEEAGRGIEYIDDSNGELGGFLNSLGQPLAEAILSLDLSAVEREKLAKKLEKESKTLSDYGIDDAVELALQALTYGWEETPPTARPGARPVPDYAVQDDEWEDDEFDDEGEWDESEDLGGEVTETGWGWRGAYGDLTEAKLNVLERQGRVEEYLGLCQRVGRHLRYVLKLAELGRVPEVVAFAREHLATADEALRLAQRLRELGHVQEALVVGEHGLTLAGPRALLGVWLGPVEEAQGRTEPALEAWLQAFPEQPSLETYQTLKRLAERGWQKLRPRLMTVLRSSHSHQALAEVLLFEEEWDEAIKVAERRDVWYPVRETVADGVLPHRPEWVAQFSVRQAEGLMIEPKSKNYPHAAEWLKRAKKAFTKLGQTEGWKTYLQRIKEEYKRRPALQEQLRKL